MVSRRKTYMVRSEGEGYTEWLLQRTSQRYRYEGIMPLWVYSDDGYSEALLVTDNYLQTKWYSLKLIGDDY